MKKVILTKWGQQKFLRGGRDFFSRDILDLGRSYTPGEWVLVLDTAEKIISMGAINLNVSASHIPILRPFPLLDYRDSFLDLEKIDEYSMGEQVVLKLLDKACYRREKYKKYQGCSRLVFGENDDLSGLIVDKYENCVLIQIQTAALDRYRQQIHDFFQQKFPQLIIHLNDHLNNRQKENLPQFEQMPLSSDFTAIKVKENHLFFQMPLTKIQKNGHYFDHRENRLQLYHLLQDVSFPLRRGLDLFSYNGSWGLHQMSAGVEQVLFVDQGDFAGIIAQNLKLNGGEDWYHRGDFLRGDCFEIIKELTRKGEKFDIITCDPPAMAKSEDKKKNALHGYTKLIGNLMGLLPQQAILAFGSCTKYISMQELEEVLRRKLQESGRHFNLLQMGMQGFDHPVQSLGDRGNYIKYFCYIVES